MLNHLKVLSVALFLCSISMLARADYLKWDHGDLACVDGYRIYYGLGVDDLTMIEVGLIDTYDLNLLTLTACKRYEFYVSAFNRVGESEKAGPVYAVRVVDVPGAPSNVRIEYVE